MSSTAFGNPAPTGPETSVQLAGTFQLPLALRFQRNVESRRRASNGSICATSEFDFGVFMPGIAANRARLLSNVDFTGVAAGSSSRTASRNGSRTVLHRQEKIFLLEFKYRDRKSVV